MERGREQPSLGAVSQSAAAIRTNLFLSLSLSLSLPSLPPSIDRSIDHPLPLPASGEDFFFYFKKVSPPPHFPTNIHTLCKPTGSKPTRRPPVSTVTCLFGNIPVFLAARATAMTPWSDINTSEEETYTHPPNQPTNQPTSQPANQLYSRPFPPPI